MCYLELSVRTVLIKWPVIFLACCFFSASQASESMEANYLKLANESYSELLSGKVKDVDALINKHKKLRSIAGTYKGSDSN
jgi:hypothetical protein